MPTQIQPSAELGTIQFGDALPPAPLVVGMSDRLFIQSHNSLADVTLQVRGRLLKDSGEIVPIVMDHAPNADRSAAFTSQQVGPGFLLGLSVIVSAGTPRRGQCYVQVGLLRGLAAFASVVQPLLADYATAGAALGWPPGRIMSSVEGPGMIRSITGTDPAAGVEISEAVPTNARWKLSDVTFTFATDANVANRRVHLIVDDGANILVRSASSTAQAAGLTETYHVGGYGAWRAVIGSEQWIAFPQKVLMFQAWRIVTSTGNMQAGDDYGAPQLLVEEWIEE